MLAFLFFVAWVTSSAWASHFRYGQITWERVSATTVRFTVRFAWRSTSIGSETFRFGDGATTSLRGGTTPCSGTFSTTGCSADTSSSKYYRRDSTNSDTQNNEYTTVTYIFAKTYASEGPFTAYIQSSARVSGLLVGANQGYRVETVVDMTNGKSGSPAAPVQVILQYPVGQASTIALNPVDPDRNVVTCRPATTAESLVTSNANQIEVVTTDCHVSVNMSSPRVPGDKWASQVILMSSGNSNTVAVDFIIEAIGTTDLPQCDVVTPIPAGGFTAVLGRQMDVVLNGSISGGSGNVTINEISVPSGLTVTPTGNVVAPVAVTLSFNPLAIGTAVASVGVIKNGVTRTCSVSFLTVNPPTNAPTSAPSVVPSSIPSLPPTTSPSDSPSVVPSFSPSAIPTVSPSHVPSASPSSSPTGTPSVSPSSMPSTSPSLIPSRAPTSSPTGIPSQSPSSGPSHSPSSNPTTIPSASPSSLPSRAPSAVPSSMPSSVPSGSPSDSPSSSPSVSPTSMPSTSPTGVPSDAPSMAPSSPPSASPTHMPSHLPSFAPSTSPTSAPSHSPTHAPTRQWFANQTRSFVINMTLTSTAVSATQISTNASLRFQVETQMFLAAKNVMVGRAQSVPTLNDARFTVVGVNGQGVGGNGSVSNSLDGTMNLSMRATTVQVFWAEILRSYSSEIVDRFLVRMTNMFNDSALSSSSGTTIVSPIALDAPSSASVISGGIASIESANVSCNSSSSSWVNPLILLLIATGLALVFALMSVVDWSFSSSSSSSRPLNKKNMLMWIFLIFNTYGDIAMSWYLSMCSSTLLFALCVVFLILPFISSFVAWHRLKYDEESIGEYYEEFGGMSFVILSSLFGSTFATYFLLNTNAFSLPSLDVMEYEQIRLWYTVLVGDIGQLGVQIAFVVLSGGKWNAVVICAMFGSMVSLLVGVIDCMVTDSDSTNKNEDVEEGQETEAPHIVRTGSDVEMEMQMEAVTVTTPMTALAVPLGDENSNRSSPRSPSRPSPRTPTTSRSSKKSPRSPRSPRRARGGDEAEMAGFYNSLDADDEDGHGSLPSSHRRV